MGLHVSASLAQVVSLWGCRGLLGPEMDLVVHALPPEEGRELRQTADGGEG